MISLNENVGLIYNILKFKLRLTFNPLNCNCNLIWLVEKAKINQINLAAICKQPDLLKDLPLNVPIIPHLNGCSLKEKSLVNENELINTKLSKNVIIGSSVILNCPTHNSKWYQNDKAISFNKYSTKFYLYPNNSLKINSLLPKDESTFICGQFNSKFIYDLKVVGN